MAESDGGYLSIGEVLGILLEEFPDVTISKIRFLESQGLINPERTPSGYRKFYEPDIELLRVILNEQKQNYLPLRVIKDRLETGEIVDPTGEHYRNGSKHAAPPTPAAAPTDASPAGAPPAEVPPERAAEADASPAAMPERRGADAAATRRGDPTPPAAQLLPGVLLDRAEFCSMVGLTAAELSELESYGVITHDESGLYDEDAVAVARPAVEFLRAGVDARHLRTFRTAAEREASLYQQLVAPRYRQRNPEARAQAVAQLKRLDKLGGQLRAALMKQALRKHL